jgi:hypothetical protein
MSLRTRQKWKSIELTSGTTSMWSSKPLKWVQPISIEAPSNLRSATNSVLARHDSFGANLAVAPKFVDRGINYINYILATNCKAASCGQQLLMTSVKLKYVPLNCPEASPTSTPNAQLPNWTSWCWPIVLTVYKTYVVSIRSHSLDKRKSWETCPWTSSCNVRGNCLAIADSRRGTATLIHEGRVAAVVDAITPLEVFDSVYLQVSSGRSTASWSHQEHEKEIVIAEHVPEIILGRNSQSVGLEENWGKLPRYTDAEWVR